MDIMWKCGQCQNKGAFLYDRYRYFTRGIDASYRHTLYRYIDPYRWIVTPLAFSCIHCYCYWWLSYQRDLTTVSPVYREDSVVHQKAASPSLLVYSQTDPVLSGVRGLISELKPEQHNLYMWRHNHSTCREQWHTLHSLRSDQFSCESIIKEKVQS